jgi:hypothetical protein
MTRDAHVAYLGTDIRKMIVHDRTLSDEANPPCTSVPFCSSNECFLRNLIRALSKVLSSE